MAQLPDTVRTLEDLAAVTGVSRSTISRVLNGGSVAEATRTRVLDAITAHGYRPNRAARTLASGRTGVVGIVFHESVKAFLIDAYFSQLLQGAADALQDHAVGMMLYLSQRSPEVTLEQLRHTGHIDGVVATATFLDDPVVDGLLGMPGLPSVFIGHRRDDERASFVDIDNIAAAAGVVDHLVGLGRRRIVHVAGSRGTISAVDRIEGYRSAIERAGLEPFVVDGGYTTDAGAAAVPSVLALEPDAVFAANDQSARGLLAALGEAGIAVPDDVAVVGFDDLPFAADLGLTTVRQQVYEQGGLAVRTLLDLLDDPGSGPRRIFLPAELVVRSSTTG